MGLGLGLGIWWPTQTSIIPGLLKALCARATYCENKLCTTATLEEIAAVRYTPPPPPTGILLEDYPGAAAAYSLRNLSSTTTNVVRVRRSYDNTEQDFSAAEITDGTLVGFTNQGWFQSLTNTFTTFTSNGVSGFDATDDAGFGEAFVNIENGASGDVVNITLDTSSLTGTWTIVLVDASGTVARSNAVLLTSGSNSVALTATGDFAFVDIFCQNPTTSISVTNFLASINVGDDGFVTTWYDQSGNINNAVQATAIEQPKIVDNGIVILENGKSGIVWSGDKRLLITSLNVQNSKRFTQISVFKTSNRTNELDWILSGYNSNNFGIAFQNNINDGRFLFDGSWRNASGMITEVNTQYLRSIYRTSDTSANVYSNENSYLSNVIGDTSYNNIPIAIGNHLSQDESPLDFIIQEIIIYPTDQSANRLGIETNINTEYTIY